MPGTMCAVARCKNSLKITKSLSKDISYHTFPKNTEPERLKTWILRTKRADKFNPMSSHICSEHFNAEDFERNLQAEMLNLKVKRQLKKSAVPSLKLLENDKSPPIGSENRLKRLQKRHFRKMTEDIIIEDQKSIDVEFEGRGPEIRDYHCIKQLLQQLFLKAPVNLSDMTSVLIHQPNIGSVIKQVADEDDEEQDEDDDDDDADQVFGITSVINITDKTSECVENLHKLMLDLSNQHSDSDTTLFVNRLLSDNDNKVGLLINERYVNIPPAISVPLFQALRKEMFKLKSKKQSYNFDYLIMICKLYKVKNDKKGNKSFENSEILWSNGEEELFDKLADYKFEFCVKNDKGPALSGTWVESDPEMIPFRRVLILTVDKFWSITDQLESWLVNNDTADQDEG